MAENTIISASCVLGFNSFISRNVTVGALGCSRFSRPEENVQSPSAAVDTLLRPSSSVCLLQPVTWRSSLPDSTFTFKHGTCTAVALNPEHVAHKLCLCVKTLIWYAGPTFLKICA